MYQTECTWKGISEHRTVQIIKCQKDFDILENSESRKFFIYKKFCLFKFPNLSQIIVRLSIFNFQSSIYSFSTLKNVTQILQIWRIQIKNVCVNIKTMYVWTSHFSLWFLSWKLCCLHISHFPDSFWSLCFMSAKSDRGLQVSKVFRFLIVSDKSAESTQMNSLSREI